MASRPPIRTARCISGRMILCFMVALCGSARIVPQSGNPAQTPPATHAQGKDAAPSNQKIAGLSVIVKIESVAGEPLFHADGYRIRITAPGTITLFNGSLKTLADVAPGTWIRFQGTRDESGIMVARSARFYPAGTRDGLTKMGPSKVRKAPDYRPVMQESLINANGDLVSDLTRIPPKDADALCAWYKVPADAALQDRVERIGLRLVPEYQKQLAPDSPAQISFRFYVVSDPNVAPALDCKPGLVLLPKRYVERLQNDDQLAALLADGVALNLMRQLGGLSMPEGIGLGNAMAGVWRRPQACGRDLGLSGWSYLTPSPFKSSNSVHVLHCSLRPMRGSIPGRRRKHGAYWLQVNLLKIFSHSNIPARASTS